MPEMQVARLFRFTQLDEAGDRMRLIHMLMILDAERLHKVFDASQFLCHLGRFRSVLKNRDGADDFFFMTIGILLLMITFPLTRISSL